MYSLYLEFKTDNEQASTRPLTQCRYYFRIQFLDSLK
jgi:hypothetical protein